ncbi:MAG: baseplate J/gp47 family protein [Reyranella sp.]|nr:baseplate J/gp47 family protein [Reyranella sp.]
MSYQLPTLTDLRNRIEADFNTRLPGADSRLPRGLLRVLSFAYATAAWSMYQFLGWISRQRLADTADDEELDRIAGVHGMARTPSATATGSATVTGINGSTVPAGAALQTGDRTVYIVQADVPIAAGTGVVQLRAAAPGKAGNQAAAAKLEFVAPVTGVATAATVIALSGGLDEEHDASFRGRLLDHLRRPPQGGTLADYVQWARAVAGVSRAWAVANWQGAGTVGVLFVFDGRQNILPLAADLVAMQALLDKKRPATTTVHAVAPILNPLAHTIALNPSSVLIRQAVEAELDDLYARHAPGATILRTAIHDAIGLATGDGDYRLIVPAADVTQLPAHMATRGAITWAAW